LSSVVHAGEQVAVYAWCHGRHQDCNASRLIRNIPLLLKLVTWGGVLFLMWYGANALRSALSAEVLETEHGNFKSLRSALLTTL